LFQFTSHWAREFPMQSLTIIRPDDWHLHLRDGAVLARTVADTALQFGRAMIMPNLMPPIVDTDMAIAYKARVDGQNSSLIALMTLYLTDHTSAQEIQRAFDSSIVKAVKLYPAGATTNSSAGVSKLEHLYHAIEKLAELGMPLLVHGEITDSHVDIFDREKRFIDQQLGPLLERFPNLKCVFEHITTSDAATFVTEASNQVAATITPQHLLYNRNDLLVGGVKPHLYCLPILKRNTHQQALQAAVSNGSKKFFLGTDSAPHAQGAKESACGCAGCYSSPAAIELYAQAFESFDALHHLEAFASLNGPDFYGLARNLDSITLTRRNWQIPNRLIFGDDVIIPLAAGQTLNWKMEA